MGEGVLRDHQCPGNDPTCPGHDGDACHYEDLPDSPAMETTDELDTIVETEGLSNDEYFGD